MAKIFIIILALLIFTIAPFAYSETIILKSGKKIEAPIIESTDDYIKVNISGVTITYYLEEIKEIIGAKNLSDEIKKASGTKDVLSDPGIIHKKPRVINNSSYIMYIPSNTNSHGKYPLVIALSPGADAQSMINAWKSTSEKFKWIILASKEHRNGMDMRKISGSLINELQMLLPDYPIDSAKVMATGFSGGGMTSHAFSMFYPKKISAIIINTGKIHDYYFGGKKYPYPKNKIAVFLASPTDFRYKEMKRDQDFLKTLGWKTKWIEFQGGHTIAPESAYKEAAQWLTEQFK